MKVDKMSVRAGAWTVGCRWGWRMDGVWFEGGGIGRSCLLRDRLGVLSRVFCGCEILFAGLRHAPPVSRMRLFLPVVALVGGGFDISQCVRRVEFELAVVVVGGAAANLDGRGKVMHEAAAGATWETSERPTLATTPPLRNFCCSTST